MTDPAAQALTDLLAAIRAALDLPYVAAGPGRDDSYRLHRERASLVRSAAAELMGGTADLRVAAMAAHLRVRTEPQGAGR